MMHIKNSYSGATIAGFLLLFVSMAVFSQEKISREEYISKYAGIACRQMEEYGIPASIKLAQALLESDNGNSLLAREANNHFGIKCHKGWEGPVFHKDDDAEDECFRKYRKAEESFTDHSLFLRGRERYAELFTLGILDYRGWAYGLSAAGYATNPKYPEMLIRIIEENKLHAYDYKVSNGKMANGNAKKRDKTDDFAPIGTDTEQNTETLNGVKYVIAQPGDTYESVAKRKGVTAWMLRKFNEVDKETQPTEGSIIFLQPKKRRCAAKEHVCNGKESIWDISMRYGIKSSRLEKINAVGRMQVPAKGTTVLLR